MINHKCKNCALHWLKVRNKQNENEQKKPRKTEEEVAEEFEQCRSEHKCGEST